jgi:hypothetical protein
MICQVERRRYTFFYADNAIERSLGGDIPQLNLRCSSQPCSGVRDVAAACKHLTTLEAYPICSACRCIRGIARTRLRIILFHILRQSFNLSIPRLRLRVHDNMALLPTTASPSQNGNSSRASQSVTNRVPVIFRRLLKFHQMVWVACCFLSYLTRFVCDRILNSPLGN